MTSIYEDGARAEVLGRLERLKPNAERQWGRMTAPQAVCHLSDAFRVALGDTQHEVVGSLLLRTVVRFVALSTTMAWPKGAKTLPAFDQELGGTPPGDFSHDVEALAKLVARFADSAGAGLFPHPAFGKLSAGEWGRWGYRHMDHHLRQFGV